MNKIPFIKQLFAVLVIAFLASCDNDFNVLGTDIVGNDNFGVGIKADYTMNVANVNVGAVESVNLPVNPLGIYNDPVYGETIANFVTQVQLETVNPTINLSVHPEIDKVVLSIPYFSTLKVPSSTSVLSTYELDSIYGPSESTMKLGVYRSNFFIRDVNPADQLPQAYYTDQNSDFEGPALSLGERLNDDDSVNHPQNDAFFFDPKETVEKDGDGNITARSGPAMTLNLSKIQFFNAIFQNSGSNLQSNNVFKNYFRGLYFKVERNGSDSGQLAMLNFRNGTITINYSEDPLTTGGERVKKKIVLKMTGNSVSLVNQAASPATDGQKIYLKGGANHSMATIDLFSGTELAQLKSQNWLINEASLTFTVSNPNTANSETTKRLYLYDLNNRRPLLDYSLDQSVSSSSKYNKSRFGGIIKRDANTNRETYKIRITNHLIRMINSDSTNVRLGLVVTEDINSITNKRVKTPQGIIKTVPTMSVAHPFGTILWGNNAPVEADRPKFEIYYTTPK